MGMYSKGMQEAPVKVEKKLLNISDQCLHKGVIWASLSMLLNERKKNLQFL